MLNKITLALVYMLGVQTKPKDLIQWEEEEGGRIVGRLSALASYMLSMLYFPLTIFASALNCLLQTSDTHRKMIKMLQENHFDTQEFILSPLQFGVPYSRPRYFCLVFLSLLSLISHYIVASLVIN